MSIGQRIRTMRLEQGLSIDDLAYRLGKNRTTIYRYENGDIENLPLGILDSLAKALNTTPAYLMGWENSTDVVSMGTYIVGDISEINYFKKWVDEIGLNMLTDDECGKVFEYAKVLVSQRDN